MSTDTDLRTATGAPYDDLAALLRGRLVRPQDSDYDDVRAVYNAMIDKRPAAIVVSGTPAARRESPRSTTWVRC